MYFFSTFVTDQLVKSNDSAEKGPVGELLYKNDRSVRRWSCRVTF